MKSALSWLLLLLIALCLSCGAVYDARLGVYHYTRHTSYAMLAHTMPVYLDINFSPQDQLAIDDALMQWNYALNGYYQFQVVDTHFNMQDDILKQALENKALVFLRIDHTNALLDPIHVRTGRVVAFTNQIGGHIIYVVRDWVTNNEDLQRLLMHEIGHTLGADDVDQNNTLMHWMYIPEYFQCIDLATLRQIAPKQHLPLEHLNYCNTSLAHPAQ